MTTSQPNNPGASQGSTQVSNPAGNEQRSEGLLPSGRDDDGRDDGRFGVAEEVNLDQQSDKLRHVGQAPSDAPAGGPTADNPDRAADDKLPDPGAQSDG